jgi:hypothetical protein
MDGLPNTQKSPERPGNDMPDFLILALGGVGGVEKRIWRVPNFEEVSASSVRREGTGTVHTTGTQWLCVVGFSAGCRAGLLTGEVYPTQIGRSHTNVE